MTPDDLPPSWRRPPGVAKGTWQYVHQRSIARHYQAFVADTPLCRLDLHYVLEHLGSPDAETSPQNSPRCQPLIVDLGCGNGRLAWPISRAGWRVLAVDLSQSMLEELTTSTQRRPHSPADTDGSAAPRTGSPTVFPLRANLVELEGVRDAIADHAICMFSTLGMVQGRDARVRLLTHVARIVRPGGTLVFHVHRKWAGLRERGGRWRLLSNAIASLTRRDVEFGDAVYPYRGLENMFMHRFSAREIRRELNAAGWTLQRIDRVDLRGEQLTESTWDASGFFVTCRR